MERPIDDLQRFAAFGRLSRQSTTLLEQHVERRHWNDRTGILCKGQPASGAYFVLQGQLRVFSIAPNGNEATLYFIDPGETCVLALNCLFNDLLYPAWVQAEAGTSIAIVPGKIYRKLFETEPSVQDTTVRTLSTLVYRLMCELEQVHSSHHKQRLVQFILARASSEGRLDITQQELAGHLGTSREVVARLIGDLQTQGAVRTRRGRIDITKIEVLRRNVSERWSG